MKLTIIFFILLTTIVSAQRSFDNEPTLEEENQYFNLLLERAEKDNSYAQNSLGDYYQSVESTNRDLEQAAFWYEKAAEGGNSSAALSLGQLYSAGILGDEKKMPNGCLLV